jgi:hypothetical protein
MVGRTVMIDARSHTVIGVMPDRFQFLGGDTDVILPMRFDRNRVFLGNFSYQGVAQLTPGVTLAQANAEFVSPDYFQTVGTPLVVGRDFTWPDVFDDRRVAVISETMAHEMWGGSQAALGKRIRVGAVDHWRAVVGVVGDVFDNGVQEPAPASCTGPS